MRPTHLVLENFGSFRGRHDLDLRDVELFVLTGPTGAGKSTVIDAMTCALYGSVPRYDNANLVEPIINKVSAQARVSLRFTVDEVEHAVTRVLRRTTSGGAQAVEVRLERVDPHVDGDDSQEALTALASGSREVLAAVVDLVGLTFDDFCKTVVLPQGAFAEFLHGQRDERQRLLVRLLGLERYRLVGEAARRRADALGAELEAIGAELARLGDVSTADVRAAEARAERLAALRTHVLETRWAELERLKESGGEAAARLREVEARVTALEALRQPEGVSELADRVRAADRALVDAGTAAEQARVAAAAAREQVAAAPDPAPLTEVLRLDGELDRRAADLAAAERRVHEATERSAGVVRVLAGAEQVAAEADRALDELRRRHLAHTLAEGLAAGDDCPVCRRTLDAAPQHPAPEELDGQERAAAAATERLDTARGEERTARTTEAGARAALDGAHAAVEQVRADLSAAAERAGDDVALGGAGRLADRDKVTRRSGERGRRAEVAAAAEGEATEAERRRQGAQQARDALEREHAEAWRTFDAARDTVAALGAPVPQRSDLAADWSALLAWAAERAHALAAEREAVAREVAEARAAWRAGAEAMADDVAGAGVELGADRQPRTVLDALAGATTAAARSVEDLRQRLAVAAERRERAQTAQGEQAVATLLGRLLRADQFTQWLLTRLSVQLVTTASRMLDELTQGAFALALDDRGGFEVIDHLNADERRPARTLSGGETFLASLALALALAEHVSNVAGGSDAGGAARLEALFLDEGFGALDPETLDTVAAAIEELSGRRMVGIITHVRELADRIPTCYEVRRGPEGSRIRERHESAAGVGRDGAPAAAGAAGKGLA